MTTKEVAAHHEEAITTQATVTCARCGAPIDCNPGAECWCAQLPFRPMPKDAAGCLCRPCLETAWRAQREPNPRPADR